MRLFVPFAVCVLAFTQGQTLNNKLDQLEIGYSQLSDAVRLLGEPKRYSLDNRTFTRDSLPDFFFAEFESGVAVSFRGGRVRDIEIESPDYVLAGGIRVGSPAEEAIRALGAPRGVIKGPMPPRAEPRPGRVYEGGTGPNALGGTSRPDLGVAVFWRGGKVIGFRLMRRTGARLKALPHYDPKSQDQVQMDLSGQDLSALDLRGRAADLLQSTFSNTTVWPSRKALPAGFDPARMLELGRNPGLGVRALHRRGITGRGVSIGFIDNPLFEEHAEYASRLRFHEYINASPEEAPHFHGSAVVSIAAGSTVGVAPEADVYYVSSWINTPSGPDWTPRARAVRRLLEINRTLPPEKRLRVISMSAGWGPNERGAAEMRAAVDEARAAGILFVCSKLQDIYGFRFQGLGRPPMAGPDRFESFAPGKFWTADFLAHPDSYTGWLLVPMDARTMAGPNSADDYVFWAEGGWSWAIPYIAGVYALAAQADPGVTPERFWEAAVASGRTIAWVHEGRTYKLGPVIDPGALLAVLARKH